MQWPGHQARGGEGVAGEDAGVQLAIWCSGRKKAVAIAVSISPPCLLFQLVDVDENNFPLPETRAK
jgi:hypothetical protein